MPYPIEAKDSIEINPIVDKISPTYEEGLEIADSVGTYLRGKKAILVTGPGELCSKTIKMWNNAGDWVYHLDNTTLFSEIRPCSVRSKNLMMRIAFATAGENSKKILKDLQDILDQHRE